MNILFNQGERIATISTDDIKSAFYDQMKRPVSFAAQDCFVDIVERALLKKTEDSKDRSITECVDAALDDGLIYTADKWAIMACYLTPEEANYSEAYNLFESDLIAIVEKLIEGLKDEK